MKSISAIAYEKYQLDWMMKHNHSLEDLINELYSIWRIEDDATREFYSPSIVYQEFQDHGFNGSLFSCYENFLDSEYTNTEYMKELLNDQEFSIYQDDVKEREQTQQELE